MEGQIRGEEWRDAVLLQEITVTVASPFSTFKMLNASQFISSSSVHPYIALPPPSVRSRAWRAGTLKRKAEDSN